MLSRIEMYIDIDPVLDDSIVLTLEEKSLRMI